MPRRPLSAAERMREYRRRKSEAAFRFSGDLPGDALAALADAGWIGIDDARDPKALGLVLAGLAREAS